MVEKISNATVIDCTKKQGYEYQVSTINNGWTLVLLRIFNPGAHDLEMKLEISCNT